MKIFGIKIFLVLAILSVAYIMENSFASNSFMPVYEHISALSQTDKQYLRTEQEIPTDKNALFIERSQLRLHKNLHETKDLAFKCERERNTDCYISAISINAVSDTDFLQKCLVKGNLPKNKNEIAINENIAKSMNYSIGDEVCLMSAILYENVEISGIIRNFYGFPDFKTDARFYIATNRGKEYQTSVIGGYYDFSDNPEGAFLAEVVSEKVSKLLSKIILQIAGIFCGLVFLNSMAFFVYKKILCLSKYHARLFSLGKAKSFVLNKRIKEVLFFSAVSFVLIVLSSFAGGGDMLALLNTAALILSSIINFLWSK